MDAVIGLAGFFGAFVAVLAGLMWLARRVRHSGAGARLMGPIDEMWNPGAHRSRQVIEVQDERMVAPGSADDPLRRR